MKLVLKLRGELKEVEGRDIFEILSKVGFNIDSVILKRGSQIVVEQEVCDGDTLELIPVASGGA